MKKYRSLLKMYLLLGLHHEYNKDDKTVQTKMYINSTHGAITLQTDSDVFFKEVFKLIKNKYENLENKMKVGSFSFRFVSKSGIRLIEQLIKLKN